MDQKDLEFEQMLDDSKALLDGVSGEEEFSLESILAEFGGGAKKKPAGSAPVKPAASAEKPTAVPAAKPAPVPAVKPAAEAAKAQPDAVKEPVKAVKPAEEKPAAKPPAESIKKDAAKKDTPQPPAKSATRLPLPELTELTEDEEYDEEAEEPAAPTGTLDAAQNRTLQEILSRTVEEVLEEQKRVGAPEEPPLHRSRIFRRKAAEAQEAREESTGVQRVSLQKEETGGESEPPKASMPPEPPIEETVADYRDAAQNARRVTRFSAIITALMWLPQVLTHFDWMPAVYHEEKLLNTLPFFIGLALICVLGREAFYYAVERLRAFKLTYELLTSLLCVAALLDTVFCLVMPSRAAEARPLHSIAALAMTCTLWGRSMLFRALYDSFRIAATGDVPYMVAVTAGGAAKRKGELYGFTASTEREDVSGRWQTIVLPVILAGVLVFSVLSTLEVKSWALYFWNLSAVLSGADALAFPLVYALPLRRLTKRVAKSGSALAGYHGADMMCRSNCITLTDSDLFPPGTVSLNGLKIFGEESGKVISYAATMAHASQSGLARLFDDLLSAEGGRLEPLSDLNFYEEGGVGGTIHGETVLFGTAAFCRRMGITLPHGMTLKTGMFLAVDGTLIAVFAVKYTAAENVDWAMHALHRARITPVLAVRDGNITQALLKKKFGTDARAVYPQLSTRLALSEKAGTHPCGLICREGLMPYAELVVGAKRLRRAVRAGNALSITASVVGTMLSFFLSFSAAYTLFTPLKLLAFLLLWTFASLVEGIFADKY